MGSTRPLIVGPESGPEPPFPLQMEGKVIKGFGRGSKEVSRDTFLACTCPWLAWAFMPDVFRPSSGCCCVSVCERRAQEDAAGQAGAAEEGDGLGVRQLPIK